MNLLNGEKTEGYTPAPRQSKYRFERLSTEKELFIECKTEKIKAAVRTALSQWTTRNDVIVSTQSVVRDKDGAKGLLLTRR